VRKTKENAIARLKKYGITPAQVKAKLANRTYKDLSSKVNF